ncbi:MAG: ethanolamine ammonia lyase large subunit, partial [Chitinophagaceae bacterium]
MQYKNIIGQKTYQFSDLKDLLAKATPHRSGDVLAGVAALTYEERIAAQMTLADVPLKQFLTESVIGYESDEITRLIIDSHDLNSFLQISSLTVGEFRDWLLGDDVDGATIRSLKWALTPEMVAAVSKL